MSWAEQIVSKLPGNRRRTGNCFTSFARNRPSARSACCVFAADEIVVHSVAVNKIMLFIFCNFFINFLGRHHVSQFLYRWCREMKITFKGNFIVEQINGMPSKLWSYEANINVMFMQLSAPPAFHHLRCCDWSWSRLRHIRNMSSRGGQRTNPSPDRAKVET